MLDQASNSSMLVRACSENWSSNSIDARSIQHCVGLSNEHRSTRYLLVPARKIGARTCSMLEKLMFVPTQCKNTLTKLLPAYNNSTKFKKSGYFENRILL